MECRTIVRDDQGARHVLPTYPCAQGHPKWSMQVWLLKESTVCIFCSATFASRRTQCFGKHTLYLSRMKALNSRSAAMQYRKFSISTTEPKENGPEYIQFTSAQCLLRMRFVLTLTPYLIVQLLQLTGEYHSWVFQICSAKFN